MNTPSDLASSFSAFVVQGDPPSAKWQAWPTDQLGPGDVTLQVEASALNYKDALASQGNQGVARQLPLIPGIDAVGKVLASESDDIQPGERFLVASAEFGTSHHGGFAEVVRVPASWLYRLPTGWQPWQAATWGTAGFTAAQSVDQLLQHGIEPSDGPVVVTGATGGVGIFAVSILGKLGFEVVASTGKPEQTDWIKSLGASSVIDRHELEDTGKRPLLKGVYAGAVDTVGGNTLATLLKSVQLHGCVTACGLVAGTDLHTTVYPFILRGVTLAGIDSANLSSEERQRIWDQIADRWQIGSLERIANLIVPEQLPDAIEQIFNGQVAGRMVVDFDRGE